MGTTEEDKMRRMIPIAVLILFAAALFAETLKVEEHLSKPTQEIKQLHATNLNKGQELYNLKKFKDSLPYLDRAIFFSDILIKQAQLRKRAQDALEEARQWVDSAGKIMKKNEANRP